MVSVPSFRWRVSPDFPGQRDEGLAVLIGSVFEVEPLVPGPGFSTGEKTGLTGTEALTAEILVAAPKFREFAGRTGQNWQFGALRGVVRGIRET